MAYEYTEDQQRIHSGLKEVGEEIANFYKDALEILDETCMLASKANLVGHLAREIDSGIRDVFAPDSIKKIIVQQNSDLEKKGHFTSILAALGEGKNNKLANEWFDVSSRFHRIAHHHGAWKSTRPVTEIRDLWNRYEKVLLRLVGSFYGIMDRLNHISKMPEPTDEILNTLSNLLKNPKSAFHFFRQLSQPKWISHLKDAGYFESQNAPLKVGDNLFPNEWMPIRVLLTIAKQHDENAEKEIIEIYQQIRDDYLAEKLDLNPYTVTLFAEILVEIFSYSFSNSDQKFFKKFDQLSSGSANWNLHGLYLTKELPESYIKRQNKIGIINLLGYCLGFFTQTQEPIAFFDVEYQAWQEITYLVEDYKLKEFVDHFTDDIIFVSGLESIRVAENAVKEIHQIDPFKFSSSSVYSIELSEQTSFSGEWETSIVRFISKGILHLKEEQILFVINEYIGSPIEIFRRIAFHIINEKFSVLKEVFFTFINQKKLTSFTHEMYVLLSENSILFSTDEFKKIIHWIENLEVERYPPEETDESMQQFRNYQVRRWLTALHPTGEENSNLLRDKREYYDSLNTIPIEHPAFDSYSSFSSGPDLPIEASEFEMKSVEEQIEYLITFSPGKNQFNPEEGLALLLKSNFLDNPSKYIFNLDDFLEVPFLYLQELIEGFIEIIKKEEIAEINLFVDFIIATFIRNASTEEKGKRFDYKKLFVHASARFIEAISKKDVTFNFSKEELLKMIDFIIKLLECDEFKDHDDYISHDYATHILNSTQGRLHLALMSLASTYAKRYRNKNLIKWPEPIKQYFTNRLKRKSQGDKDFSIVLGLYLPTLYYFDKNWCVENLSKIFPAEEQHFEYTIGALLTPNSRFQWNTFEILKKNSIISRAINSYQTDSKPLGTLLNYGLHEFVFKNVSLNSKQSTLRRVLNKGASAQIEKLVEMLWLFKTIPADKLTILWDALLDKTFTNPKKYAIAIKSLTWLIDLLNEINDETCNRLMRSVAFFEINDREAYSFIRSIFKVSETNLKNAGTLLLATLRQTKLIAFMDDTYNIFVEKLYSNDLKKIADDICLYVGDSGELTLKGVYDKYNS